jgi:hypothetical protein
MTKSPALTETNADEKIAFGMGFIFSLFWGFILTDSGLEQMGLIPNLVIRPEMYGKMTNGQSVSLVVMGIVCYVIAGLLVLLMRQRRS